MKTVNVFSESSRRPMIDSLLTQDLGMERRKLQKTSKEATIRFLQWEISVAYMQRGSGQLLRRRRALSGTILLDFI
jgi:hypothetical protein